VAIQSNLQVNDMDAHSPLRYKLHRKIFDRRNEASDMNNSVIGLAIAKYIFHLFTVGADGKPAKKKLKRHKLLAFFANYPVSIFGIEACGSDL
jgi:transposase